MSVVLVTGANRGLGRELVRHYAHSGAHVLACCRRPAEAAALERLREETGAVEVYGLDVADPESIHRLKSQLGMTPVDILINNAAVAGPEPQTAWVIDYDKWLETFRVNAMGPFLMAQAFYENLRAGGEKKLVAITSGLGSVAQNAGGGWYGYKSSKAALNSLMRGLSRDWAKDGILVGLMSPGSVRTGMGGATALQSPEESVAHLVRRIAELGPEISGEFLRHTGGTFAW